MSAVLARLREKLLYFRLKIFLFTSFNGRDAAINGLERKYGKKFYTKFKTITFDNGIEFMDYEGMEKSCLRKGTRTKIYYAHPYCSGERGSNENNNRMIRRWIPKGTLIDDIPNKFIKQIEDWLNNYPRAMFDYKSSNMLLLNIWKLTF